MKISLLKGRRYAFGPSETHTRRVPSACAGVSAADSRLARDWRQRTWPHTWLCAADGTRVPRRALQSSTRGALCTFVLTLLPLLRQPATPTRTIAATPMQTLPQSQPTPKRIDTPSLEEPSDLEELEQFAKTFKQRRIKLGFTQVGRTRPSLGCPSSPAGPSCRRVASKDQDVS